MARATKIMLRCIKMYSIVHIFGIVILEMMCCTISDFVQHLLFSLRHFAVSVGVRPCLSGGGGGGGVGVRVTGVIP